MTISIDPSIANVGYAVFTDAGSLKLSGVFRARIDSKTTGSTEFRLGLICEFVSGLVLEHRRRSGDPGTRTLPQVVVEGYDFRAADAGRTRNKEDLGKMIYSIGAIIGTARSVGCEVVTYTPAQWTKRKSFRKRKLASEIRLQRVIKNEHEADAIGLGLFHLDHQKLRDLVEKGKRR